MLNLAESDAVGASGWSSQGAGGSDIPPGASEPEGNGVSSQGEQSLYYAPASELARDRVVAGEEPELREADTESQHYWTENANLRNHLLRNIGKPGKPAFRDLVPRFLAVAYRAEDEIKRMRDEQAKICELYRQATEDQVERAQIAQKEAERARQYAEMKASNLERCLRSHDSRISEIETKLRTSVVKEEHSPEPEKPKSESHVDVTKDEKPVNKTSNFGEMVSYASKITWLPPDIHNENYMRKHYPDYLNKKLNNKAPPDIKDVGRITSIHVDFEKYLFDLQCRLITRKVGYYNWHLVLANLVDYESLPELYEQLCGVTNWGDACLVCLNQSPLPPYELYYNRMERLLHTFPKEGETFKTFRYRYTTNARGMEEFCPPYLQRMFLDTTLSRYSSLREKVRVMHEEEAAAYNSNGRVPSISEHLDNLEVAIGAWYVFPKTPVLSPLEDAIIGQGYSAYPRRPGTTVLNNVQASPSAGGEFW
ncbi:hypothetical protein TRICI_002996 [Trichomonascus ciferrii]|uniref:Uncharacterized protein n=1 Tax=Trichomonascus ciferrii TaxID=44093 RepID=A0A642V4V1_9ASCO|nr:hypothetical protein TRICI_002996 [Trichomonascus ciferrii]